MHTKGPWYDDGYRIYAPTDKEDKRDARIIVEYKHRDNFNNDDSHLLRAAPELLEALEQAVLLFHTLSPILDDKTLYAFTDLIAKAKGLST